MVQCVLVLQKSTEGMVQCIFMLQKLTEGMVQCVFVLQEPTSQSWRTNTETAMIRVEITRIAQNLSQYLESQLPYHHHLHYPDLD